jgi:WD40 repeat protein
MSKDERLIFVPSNTASIIACVDTQKFEVVNTLKPLVPDKLGMLMCIRVIDGWKLLASYENGDLILFDCVTFSQIDVLKIFDGHPLLYFDYSQAGNIGVAACSEQHIRRFSIDDSRIVLKGNVTELTNPGVNCVKIRMRDDKIFVTAGWDFRIRVFSTKKARLLCVLDFHKEAVNFLDFSNDNILAAGSNEGLISFWNLYNESS